MELCVVCYGTLTILASHFDYAKRVPEGVAFLVDRVKVARASSA